MILKCIFNNNIKLVARNQRFQIVSLNIFMRESRTRLTLDPSKKELRIVSISNILSEKSPHKLADFIADKAPLYYREFDKVVESLQSGFFLSAIRETLKRLPDSDHFKSSHFGEILASVFVEDVLGLKKLYCKLSLNSTENQNAFKMDLLCYIPGSDPVEFVFCEVKSSPKDAADGMPPKHDASCYADIFNSLRTYNEGDKAFDLTTLKDRLDIQDPTEKRRVKESLLPYASRKVGYIGVALIDLDTYLDTEVPVLATRKSDKIFNIELLCVEQYKNTSAEVYQILEKYKN